MDLETLMRGLEQATWATPWIALAWGVASVALSPCHLSSVPLLVTFLGRLDGQTLSPARLSALVTAGVSVSLVVVGGLTFALGRLVGDLWGVGPWIAVALLLVGGLHLMGAIELPSVGQLDPNTARVGPKSALVSGALLGTTLGPCTFSFFAPVLALAGGGASTTLAVAAIATFVVGHLGMTWALGVAGAALGGRLGARATWAERARFGVGALAIAVALGLIVTTP